MVPPMSDSPAPAAGPQTTDEPATQEASSAPASAPAEAATSRDRLASTGNPASREAPDTAASGDATSSPADASSADSREADLAARLGGIDDAPQAPAIPRRTQATSQTAETPQRGSAQDGTGGPGIAAAPEAQASPDRSVASADPAAAPGGTEGETAAGEKSGRIPVTRQPALAASRSARVIIRKGDTLWRISRETYGAGNRYTVIYLANGDQIRNPDRIYPGQVFRMPEERQSAGEVPGAVN